ncbi:hypothetical protein SDRG_03865 [Saprolegnia diclina VS20]|uniref:Uncharacterized protein n=1 Tax=Saprolegnia diclina (strain VS20) TaxID=1156394 RepID=T0S7Y7_SAPDV|nr:hypothetical protein SDRG_03865 [Saprolegnia diclina VS20]EQC38907.1 hypothetical protein SDRG_03865 [Saprolegnia diclina VS20]|eukprot:XP_008607731.1 hypothetical protein SDRG_03865 [Saprolegnia diclina VS20]
MHASVKKAHKVAKVAKKRAYRKGAKQTAACDGTQVSVLGDATYCVQGSACSGSSKAGVCPLASSAPIADCVPGIVSFDPSTQTCSLPADATCTDLGNGAFGCVLEEKTPAPTTASNETGDFGCADTEVSVLGDATYCIQGNACSGSSKAGACPLAQSTAHADCVPGIPSYDPISKTCTLTDDTECSDLGNGAFGCDEAAEEVAAVKTQDDDADVEVLV